MDAIVYFYKKKDIEEPELSMMYRGDYLLVKAGLDADRQHWFGVPFPDPPADLSEDGEESYVRPEGAGKGNARLEGAGKAHIRSGRTGEVRVPPEAGKAAGSPARQGRFFGFLGGRRRREGRWERKRERRRQEEAVEQYQQRLALFEGAVEQTARRLKQAMGEVDQGLDIQSVYELELAFLAGEDGAAGIWNRCWGMPEFRDYCAPRWAAPLAEKAVGPRFVLLGAAEAVPEVLKQCARRMKSLRWILPAEECGPQAQDFAEEFCEEYGLAVSPEPWPAGRICLRFSGEEPPVCVLDFAGEGTAYGGVLPERSVWIDFCSAEEKERRFRRLKPDVNYVSLKKYWRECRRGSGARVNLAALENVEIVPRFHKYSSFLDSR